MVRVWVFVSALLIYALFSAPTPDHTGLAEYLVMAGMLAAIGAGGLMQAAGMRMTESQAPWILPARLFLLFGLTVPLITGLAQGHPVSLIMRDMIPFLFLLLPLFLSPVFMDRAHLAKFFPYLLCAMGLIFVVRVMAAFFYHVNAGHFPLGFMPDPDNLVNAPTVLFAAIFLTGIGGLKFIKATTWRMILPAFICFALTLVLLAGMAGIGQRAHIGAWALTVMFWLCLLLWKNPRALVRPLLLLILAGLLLWPYAADILHGLMQKTSVVGLNNRVEEARVVWESFRDRPLALIFGQGWGASIVSPAVGPNPVNYTHNLFTTHLLKGGLCGVTLVLLYLGTLGHGIWRILWAQPVWALAVAAPFLIDITLYASFKSLDFGLLLALLALWTRSLPVPVKVAS